MRSLWVLLCLTLTALAAGDFSPGGTYSCALYTQFDATPPGGASIPNTDWLGFQYGFDPNTGTKWGAWFPPHFLTSPASTPLASNLLFHPVTGAAIPPTNFTAAGITVPYDAAYVNVAAGEFPLIFFLPGGQAGIFENHEICDLVSRGNIVIAPLIFLSDYTNFGSGYTSFALSIRGAFFNRILPIVQGWNTNYLSPFYRHIATNKVMVAGWSDGGIAAKLLPGGNARIGITANPQITSLLLFDPASWIVTFEELQTGSQLPTMEFASDELTGLMDYERGFAANANLQKYYSKPVGSLHHHYAQYICPLGRLSLNAGIPISYEKGWNTPGLYASAECNPSPPPTEELKPWANPAVVNRLMDRYIPLFIGVYQYGQWELALELQELFVILFDADYQAGLFEYKSGQVCGNLTWAAVPSAVNLIEEHDNLASVQSSSSFTPAYVISGIESGGDIVDGPAFPYFDGQVTATQYLDTPGCVFPPYWSN